MLRVEPEERWNSMSELVTLLEDLPISNSSSEELRQRAVASYLRLQLGADFEQKFYGTFYRRLFELVPEARGHFAEVDMGRQHRLLNRAIKMLMEFDPARPETGLEIERVAGSHQKYGLSASHFEAFRRALLETVYEVGERDTGIHDAWNKVITPGLDHMAQLLNIAAPLAPARRTRSYPMS